MSGSSDNDFVPTEDCVSVRQQTTLLDKRKRRRRSVKKLTTQRRVKMTFLQAWPGTHTSIERARVAMFVPMQRL